MIQPTVGRVVHYYPDKNTAESNFTRHNGGPFAAVVAYVWNPRMVNLTVLDHNGQPHSRTSVQLVQPEDAGPAMQGMAYCEWMLYQKGQAARTEALEQQVGAGG